MRFRILDLFLITTFIAAMFGAYANDLIIFRQALFLACTTAFATAGCFHLSKKRLSTTNGAIAGSIGGLAFTLMGLLSPFSFYIPSNQPFLTSTDLAAINTAAVIELAVAPFLATILGAALGPLFYFYLKGKTFENPRNQMLSWCFLAAACLLLLLSMKDRLDYSSSSRNWSYIVPILLMMFFVHTVHWVQKEHRKTIASETAKLNEPEL